MALIRPIRVLLVFLLAALLLCAWIDPAYSQVDKTNVQSNGPDAPIQPLPPDATSGGQAEESVNNSAAQNNGSSNEPQPDTHLLSSGEVLGLGSLRTFRRLFDPSLQFSQSGQTGIILGRILSVSSVGGGLDFAENARRYRIAVAYNGAETIYQPFYFGIHYLPYHRLGISQQIVLSRWTLRLRDDLQYSWGAGFSGIFTGGPQVGQSTSLTSIQPSLAPNETIETGLVRQLSNVVLAEADYALSRRTTLTLMGSYNLMHFFSTGYIDSRDVHERAGYNYALSAKNNIGLTYDHDQLSFNATSSRIQTDTLQMGFGRKLTGRLAFQAAAGPELLNLYNLGASHTRQLSWSAFSAFTYALRHNLYSLNYSHATTSGSGVFVGSDNDTLTATATHDFTRFWSASLSAGYAINRDLATVTIFANRFDNWYARVSLNRPIGRQLQFGLNYEFEQQSGGGGTCPVASCGFGGSLNQFGVTLAWHPVAHAR